MITKQKKDITSLSVILPAFNEENNLVPTITKLIHSFNKRNFDWQLILIDDGSTDRTGEIAERLSLGQPKIKIIHHKHNMGIGYCFRQGVENANKEIITWMPADGENDINELIKYFVLLEHVDIIIPFVVNIGMRSWWRRFLSTAYIWIINLSFGTMFNYTNGNVIYRNRVLEVVKPKSNGFFFQTECLIKAIRAGFMFAEVPVYLKKRKKGHSKALTIKSLCTVVWEFIILFLAVHIFRTAGRVPKDL